MSLASDAKLGLSYEARLSDGHGPCRRQPTLKQSWPPWADTRASALAPIHCVQ